MSVLPSGRVNLTLSFFGASFGFPVFEPGDHQCSPVGWSLELGVFCNGSELTPEL
jgi:hypothetical protein